MVVLVMGVAGSGKTTVGQLVAERLACVYAEADAFHPPANIAKMAAGHPLDDADRAPWLAAIRAWIDARLAASERGVVTCSALKRSYRDFLRESRPGVRLVYLHGDRALLLARLARRRDHFFKPDMLDSQLDVLEEPEADEDVVRVSVHAPPEEIADAVVAELGLGPAGTP